MKSQKELGAAGDRPIGPWAIDFYRFKLLLLLFSMTFFLVSLDKSFRVVKYRNLPFIVFPEFS